MRISRFSDGLWLNSARLEDIIAVENDENRMTNDETRAVALFGFFGLRHYFVIRYSIFDIRHSPCQQAWRELARLRST